MSKIVDDPDVTVGDLVTYRVRVVNRGSSDAARVSVEETWPAGVQLVSNDPSQGSYDVTRQVWTVGALSFGQSETLTLVGRVTSTGPIVNAVAVSGSGTDPQVDNNDATVTLRADAAGDLPDTGGPGAGWLVTALALLLTGSVLIRRVRRR